MWLAKKSSPSLPNEFTEIMEPILSLVCKPATPEWDHLLGQGPGTNGEEAKYGDKFVDSGIKYQRYVDVCSLFAM